MAKGTGKNEKPVGEAPANTKGKPGPKTDKVQREMVTVKSGALSVDIGPMVIAGLAKSWDVEQKANAMLMEVESKRYDLLSQTTAAIVKAVKADDSIDLSVAFKGDPKLMNVLNDQLGIALGFREITVGVDAGGNEIKRVATAKAVAKYFPGPKDDKNSQEYKRKSTLRSNFLHMVKKCAMAASGLIESDTQFVQDKESGTLQISGPAVKKAFGQETVLLNEKQVVGEGENSVKLAQKPSFTAVAKMGAEAAGKVLPQRSQTGISGAAVNTGEAVQKIAKSLADVCAKLKLPADEATKKALAIALNAIDRVLKGSQVEEKPAA